MASTFKNAGLDVGVLDTSAGDIYTASGSGVTSVIPAVPAINAEPEYQVTIDIDDEFVNKFIKAKNAIPESENFGVACKDKVAEIIINYSSIPCITNEYPNARANVGTHTNHAKVPIA